MDILELPGHTGHHHDSETPLPVPLAEAAANTFDELTAAPETHVPVGVATEMKMIDG